MIHHYRYWSVLVVCVSMIGLVPAQNVYKCTDTDGSITYSQTPCESDTDSREVMDATPHQGHASPKYSSREESLYQKERSKEFANARSVENDADLEPYSHLSRAKVQQYKQKRKLALRNLKSRTLLSTQKARYIKMLLEADRLLGFDVGDLEAMTQSDRRVYSKHGIHPGQELPRHSRTASQSARENNNNSEERIRGQTGQQKEDNSAFITDAKTGKVMHHTGGDQYIDPSSGEIYNKFGGNIHRLSDGEVRPVID